MELLAVLVVLGALAQLKYLQQSGVPVLHEDKTLADGLAVGLVLQLVHVRHEPLDLLVDCQDGALGVEHGRHRRGLLGLTPLVCHRHLRVHWVEPGCNAADAHVFGKPLARLGHLGDLGRR